MNFIKIFLILSLFSFISCSQESEESSSLVVGHRTVENAFSVDMPTDGTYAESENLDFTVTHPTDITVTGTPYLTVTVGEDVYQADYVSGSGSSDLVFRYTLQAGDEDLNGVTVASGINLNGGTMKFTSKGVEYDAPTSISTIPDAEVYVDTTQPVITAVATPLPDTYKLNDTLYFVFTFDDQILISGGTPRLELNIGGVTQYASYLSGNGTSTLIFVYTIGATDSDSDGIVMVSPLQENGATVTDLAGNSADLTYALPDTSLVLVDGAGPYVTSVTPPSDGTYFNGQILTVSLVFDQTVNVASGTPSIDLTIGGSTRTATYNAGTGSNTLDFTYTVTGSDLDNDGIVIGNLITLNGATIRDGSSDDAILTYSPPLTPNVLVYGITPTIVSVTAPADGDYVDSSTLDFNVLYSEAVDVTNTPRLVLNVGGATRYADYIAGTGTDTLTFRYTVGGGDNDNDGITFNSTSIDLNTSGTIVSDYSGANAALGFSGLEPTMTGITVNQTPVTQLVITQEPTDAYVDTDISPSITVELRDAGDSLVTSATDNVTIAIITDPVGGSGISGTLTVAAVAGVATFSDIEIDTVGSGFQLQVTSGGLTPDTSATFDILAANATKLGFNVHPSDAVAGVDIAPSITVEILDSGDNVVTSATNNVTLSFGNDASSGTATLGGTLTVAAVAGVATFNDIDIDKAFTGYTLTATSASLTSDTSNAFNITANSATQLAFYVEPSNVEINTAIAPAIEVQIQDAYGNKTADTDTITLTINNDPPTGTTLGGDVDIAAVNGTATFSDIELDQLGTGFTLDADGGAYTTATSSAFNVTTTPTKLVITQEPTDTYANFAISPAITVEIQDASNNLVTSATDNVTVAINTNPGSGVLSGTLTVAAVAGVATFSDLEIDDIQNGYDLIFTSGSLTADTSDPFNITAAPATKVVFVQQPTDATAGVDISPAITVEIRDAADNVVNSTDNVTIAFDNDASSGSATLGGTLTVAAVAGVATFSDIDIDKAFTGYTLEASSGALTVDTSDSFDITPASATKLGFTVQPAGAAQDVVMSPNIEVSILDAYDNVVTTETDNITIAFNNDPSSGSATLAGTLTKAAVAGVATFDDIDIDWPETGYTFDATGGGYTLDTSDAFNIYGTPTKLGFNTQPVDTELGSNLPSFSVVILDAADNVVGSATNAVTIAFYDDPSSGSANLTGTLSVAAVNGIATFTGIDVDEAYANYTFSATSGVLTSTTSNPFDIQLAAPDTLTLITPGSSPDSDTTPTIRVSTVANTDNVKLYTDASCTTQVASATATGGTIDITTNSLAEGSHTIYAKRISSGGTPSACSTASLAYEVSGSFYQLDSLADSDFGNWSNVGGDDGDWDTNSGGTPSDNVGPTSAKSGTHYAYTEASDPTNDSDVFYLESNTLDGSANDLAFNFHWNKRGDDMGDIEVEVSNNNGSTWTSEWSHTGADIALAGVDTWRYQWIDLCDAGYTGSQVKIRFKVTMPGSGDRYHSDIAVDELEVTSGGCAPAAPAVVEITTPTETTGIGLLNESNYEVSGTCSDNGQNITLSGDVSGSTSCSSGTWSIFLNLTSLPDGNVTITADHTSSAGGANGSDTVIVVKDTNLIQFDAFDTLGNWTNNVTDDDQDWSVISGNTASNNVGPTDDQEGGGGYVYTEASTPAGNNDEFHLESNSLDAGTYNLQINFYWNKRGSTMGDLYLEVSTDGGSSWDAAVWSHTGVDVADGGTDVWNEETIDLCNQGYNSGNILVRFRGRIPSGGTRYKSDMAIDSVKFTNDGCP